MFLTPDQRRGWILIIFPAKLISCHSFSLHCCVQRHELGPLQLTGKPEGDQILSQLQTTLFVVSPPTHPRVFSSAIARR